MKDMRGNVTEQFDVHAVAFLRLATTFLIFGSVAFAIVLLIGAPEQRLRLIGPTVVHWLRQRRSTAILAAATAPRFRCLSSASGEKSPARP
ncbi:MAG: hypothetical protein IPG33_07655 [Betaproteobacteria bacterium]|nr:hypothetical protein [Betaproteobacteria bacterium]